MDTIAKTTIGHSDTPEKDCISFGTPSGLTDIIPDFSEIHSMFVASYKIPSDVLSELGEKIESFQITPPHFNFKFGDIDMPSMQDAYAALATYSGQLLMVIKMALQELKKFLNFELPKMPELGFSLDDIFSPSGKLVDELKAKFNSVTDVFKDIPPIFIGIGSKTMEYSTLLLGGIVKYVGVLVDFVIGKIKDFIDYLSNIEQDISKGATDTFKSAVDLFNSIPSYDDVMSKIKNNLKGDGKDGASGIISDIIDEVKGDFRKIIETIRNLKFPDFDFKLPDPLFPKMDIPFVEMVYSFTSMMSQLYAAVLKKLKDVIDMLPIIEVPWPKIGDWFKTPAIPTFCATDAVEKVKKETELQQTLGINTQQSIIDNRPSIIDAPNFSPTL